MDCDRGALLGGARSLLQFAVLRLKRLALLAHAAQQRPVFFCTRLSGLPRASCRSPRVGSSIGSACRFGACGARRVERRCRLGARSVDLVAQRLLCALVCRRDGAVDSLRPFGLHLTEDRAHLTTKLAELRNQLFNTRRYFVAIGIRCVSFLVALYQVCNSRNLAQPPPLSDRQRVGVADGTKTLGAVGR